MLESALPILFTFLSVLILELIFIGFSTEHKDSFAALHFVMIVVAVIIVFNLD